MLIKFLTTSKTTVLECLYANTKTEDKTLLHLFFDNTEEASS